MGTIYLYLLHWLFLSLSEPSDSVSCGVNWCTWASEGGYYNKFFSVTINGKERLPLKSKYETQTSVHGRSAWNKDYILHNISVKHPACVKYGSWANSLEWPKRAPGSLCLWSSQWVGGDILASQQMHVLISEWERSWIKKHWTNRSFRGCSRKLLKWRFSNKDPNAKKKSYWKKGILRDII